ncbi:MAG TPA: hypothetical protein PLN69_06245 [bacterium]|nr:hypothetical protein [bacterium]
MPVIKHRALLTITSAFLLLTNLCFAQEAFEKVLPDDLVIKYNHYLDGYKARHIYKGGTVEALLDDETKSKVVQPYGLGDSQGWTGLTMSAFAFQGDWELVRTNLSYWDLVVREPGRYVRYPEIPPDYGHGDTSIDQYGEMIMGIVAVYLTGPEDLKRNMADITRDIIVYGNSHNWIMGNGPFTDCDKLRFLFQLMSEKMGIGIDVYREGENYESLRDKFLSQFQDAVFIRNGTPRYFNMNLYFERLFVAKLLKPGIKGLDKAIRDWYKVVRKDNNSLFDWFYAKVAGKERSFLVERLRDFPENLPNQWEQSGYHWGYRWERSPEELQRKASGISLEFTGMDFLVLASYYSYFELNDF